MGDYLFLSTASLFFWRLIPTCRMFISMYAVFIHCKTFIHWGGGGRFYLVGNVQITNLLITKLLIVTVEKISTASDYIFLSCLQLGSGVHLS